jgi:hypothetical protein
MRATTEIRNEMKKVAAKGRDLNRLQNEGGEGYDHTDNVMLAKLTNELMAADFAENWSIEQTQEKRIAWNNEVRAAIVGGKVPVAALSKIMKKLGFNLAELKKAINYHNL